VELVPLYFRYRRTQRLNTTSSAIINKRSPQQQQHLLLAICKKNAQQLHVAASGKSNSNNRKQTIVLSPALKSAPNPRGHPIYCRHFGKSLLTKSDILRMCPQKSRVLCHGKFVEKSTGVEDSGEGLSGDSVARHFSNHTVVKDFPRRKVWNILVRA